MIGSVSKVDQPLTVGVVDAERPLQIVVERAVNPVDFVERRFEIFRLGGQKDRRDFLWRFGTKEMRHGTAIEIGQVVILDDRLARHAQRQQKQGRREPGAVLPAGAMKQQRIALGVEGEAKVCRYSSVWSTQKRRYCAITRRSISEAAIVPALTSASISSVPAGMKPASTASDRRALAAACRGWPPAPSGRRKSISVLNPRPSRRVKSASVRSGKVVGAIDLPPSRLPAAACAVAAKITKIDRALEKHASPLVCLHRLRSALASPDPRANCAAISQPRNDPPGRQHDVVFHVDSLQDALDRETVDRVEH